MAGEVTLVDLVKRFGDVTAVDGINLEMPSGEFFSMLGPSGCGKTTTLRMIAGFEQPTEGRILLDGNDMAYTPPHKRNVNTVFQSYALFPHLNVADNVAFGLRRQKVSKARDPRAGRRDARARPADRLREAKARPDVGRPAAARRAGARARPEACGAAARRAARRARRQAQKGAPGRAEGAPAAGRDHVRLRDPRPGGGAHDERPDRGHGRRPGRADGAAARGLRGAVHCLRRRLPRGLEPDGRRGRGGREHLPPPGR